MIVTFDLSLIKIYKNAIIFSIVAFPKNILLTFFLAILSAVIYLMFLTIPTVTILFFIAVLFLFAFISFIINFVVYPVIEKKLIIPYYKDRNNKNSKFIYEDGHLYQNYDYKEDEK
jgi:predicted membrane protein